MVIISVIRNIPLAILSFPEFTAHVKAPASINSEKLMAAVSNDLFSASIAKKYCSGLEPAFQK